MLIGKKLFALGRRFAPVGRFSSGRGRFFLVAALTSLCLSGCRQAPNPSRVTSCESLLYVQKPPVSLPVSSVHLHVGPQARDTNSLALVSLPDMLRQWSKEHWNPTGGGLRLCFNVSQLSLTTERVPCYRHSTHQEERSYEVFRARMVVSGEWQNPQGRPVSRATWTLFHEKTVPSHYTLEQRKSLWYDVYVGLLNQLTQEADVYVSQHEQGLGDCP